MPARSKKSPVVANAPEGSPAPEADQTTALVKLPDLPGANSIDKELVKVLKAEVHDICAKYETGAAFEVGKLLYERLFGSSADAVDSKLEEHKSFRALGGKKNGLPSYSWLSLAVRAYRQLKVLPPDSATKLPLAHHKILLPIKDPDAKKALAQRAIDQSMTKSDLETAARRIKGKRGATSTGRPVVPDFLKALRVVEAAIPKLTAPKAKEDPFSEFSAGKLKIIQEAQETVASINSQWEAFGDVIDAITTRLDELEAATLEPPSGA